MCIMKMAYIRISIMLYLAKQQKYFQQVEHYMDVTIAN